MISLYVPGKVHCGGATVTVIFCDVPPTSDPDTGLMVVNQGVQFRSFFTEYPNKDAGSPVFCRTKSCVGITGNGPLKGAVTVKSNEAVGIVIVAIGRTTTDTGITCGVLLAFTSCTVSVVEYGLMVASKDVESTATMNCPDPLCGRLPTLEGVEKTYESAPVTVTKKRDP